MGKWVREMNEDVLHYFKDDKEADRHANTGVPLFGDVLVERGRFSAAGPFWYAVRWGTDSKTGHFFRLHDAKKWAEENA